MTDMSTICNADVSLGILTFEEHLDPKDDKNRVYYSILVEFKPKGLKYFVEKRYNDFKDLYDLCLSKGHGKHIEIALKEFEFPSKYVNVDPENRMPILDDLLQRLLDDRDNANFISSDLVDFIELRINITKFEIAEAQKRAEEEAERKKKADIEAEIKRQEEIKQQVAIYAEQKRIADEKIEKDRIAFEDKERQRKFLEDAEAKKKVDEWSLGKLLKERVGVGDSDDTIDTHRAESSSSSTTAATSSSATATADVSSRPRSRNNSDSFVTESSKNETINNNNNGGSAKSGWYPGKHLKRLSIVQENTPAANPPPQPVHDTHKKPEATQPKDANVLIKSNTGFYMNIILLNKEEVVAKKVGEKLETKGFSKGGLLGRATSYAANKLVKDEKVLDTLAETLTAKIGEQTAVMGITAKVTKKFQQGSFVVLRVTVEEIDKLRLIVGAKGPEFATNFQMLLDCLDDLGIDKGVNIDEKISKQVLEGMMRKFEEMIPKKMEESGLVVECSVVSIADQADHFYSLLERIHESVDF